MKKHIQSRNVKYGAVSLMLTALVLAAVVAFNVVISLLATRYEWLYISLAPQKTKIRTTIFIPIVSKL